MLHFRLSVLVSIVTLCRAWIVPQNTGLTLFHHQHKKQSPLFLADSTAASSTTTTTTESTQDEDDNWEYVEFDRLTENDLVGSEWLLGTCWDNSPEKIEETWCRLVTNDKGENLAIWGDNSSGKWALDVASQYLTISKNYLWGKQIWACVVEDYYFLRGTVRGWSYLSAAAVVAQWQAKRLGVDPEEAGAAPWFEEEEGEVFAEQDSEEQD